MKSMFKIARMLAVFGQVGFSLITPPVLMSVFGWWLWQRFELGVWIIALFLVLGLLTSAAGVRRLWRKLQNAPWKQETETRREESPVVFYRHE